MTKKKLKITKQVVAQDKFDIKIRLSDSSHVREWYRNVTGLFMLNTLTLQVDPCWNRFNRPRITDEEKKVFETVARQFLIDLGAKVISDTTWVGGE